MGSKYEEAKKNHVDDFDGDLIVSVAGNQDGRSTAIGYFLTVHGSIDADKRDKRSFYVIGHRDGKKKGILRFERYEQGDNLYKIRLLRVSDNRSTAAGYCLAVHGSKGDDKRDSSSIYVISTKEEKKASIWKLIECGDGNYYICCNGNVDGRKIGIGYLLTIHDSNKKDVRDKGSYFVHVRNNDHKSTKWKIVNL